MKKKQRKQPKLHKVYSALGITFLCFLLLIFVGNILHPVRSFSVSEEREKPGRPAVSAGSLLHGKSAAEYEEFAKNQFVGRSFLVRCKAFLDTFAGGNYSNGVYHGKDDYLLEEIAIPEEKQLQTKLDAVQNFAMGHSETPICFMMVPNAGYIFKDKLPAFVEPVDQRKMITDVKSQLSPVLKWVDTLDILEVHADEPLYYHTDSHWTTSGAFLVFDTVKSQLQLFDYNAAEIEAEDAGNEKETQTKIISGSMKGISNTFNGNLSKISGFNMIYKEAIYAWLPEDISEFAVSVQYDGNTEKSASLYSLEKLKSNNQYQVFLSGNHGLTQIDTNNPAGHHVMVIGDSYMNNFITLMAPYCRSITAINPQFFDGDLDEVLSAKEYDEILFLYNMNTFCKEDSLADLLER